MHSTTGINDAVSPDVDVVVVGGGLAGIAVASTLLRSGIDRILVLEQAHEFGGTWRDNVYPGVACDIPSHLYAFERHPNPYWSHKFAQGQEIAAYLQRVADKDGVTAVTQFDTAMLHARWDEDAQQWRLTTSRGTLNCGALILAMGRLAEPSIPQLPGLEYFPGPIMHSARFDPTINLSHARVGIVGSGASGVQMLPEIARRAAHTTLFQRTPSWIVPRRDREITPAEQQLLARSPKYLAHVRSVLFDEFETGIAARLTNGAARAALRNMALDHLATQVSEAQLRKTLTPTDEIGCRRVVLSDDFYPAIAHGDAQLVPAALTAFDGDVAVAASGARTRLDAVILATGFNTTHPAYAQMIVGKHNTTLAAHWADGMTAWASTMVPGFPNMFVIDGPNAAPAHNSAVFMIESQAEFVTSVLSTATWPVEVSTAMEESWTHGLTEVGQDTVWMSGCESWYLDAAAGRLTALWPSTATAFRDRLRNAVQELTSTSALGI